MSDYPYQLAIVGGGPAGYTAAVRAAKLGLKTVVIEKTKNLGGTCLNVGCIPSKTLLSSSEHYAFARHHLADHGVIAEGLKVDLGVMMKRKNDVVTKLARGIDFLFKSGKIDRLEGYGRLVDGHTIEVESGGAKKTVRAENILLATGSEPVEIPSVKFDGKRVISSDQAIALDQVPGTLIVIGAGAIGLELGSVWNRLGAQVTVLEFLPRIAPGCDADVAKALQASLQKQGLAFELNAKVEGAEVTAKGVKVKASRGAETLSLEADIVLVAVGRKPFTKDLQLEKAGVALTERGRIKVDAKWRTSVPSIYAVGDVIDGPMLAHKAEEEGVAVVENLAGKHGHVNYDVIPNVVYTGPEAAAVGLTEEAAKEKGIAYRKGQYPFMANGRALAVGFTEGFVKIIADAKTDRVLGVHILGANASELIAEAVLLMEFGGSSEDLARTVHAHPTMAEAAKSAAWALLNTPLTSI